MNTQFFDVAVLRFAESLRSTYLTSTLEAAFNAKPTKAYKSKKRMMPGTMRFLKKGTREAILSGSPQKACKYAYTHLSSWLVL
ncbi:hypothetical protein GCM10027443_40190 [Pontibacter brevis]